jgi:hypothetical protein
MHHPYLAFCISGSGELVITHQRDQDRKRPLEMEIPLAELEGKGRENEALAIGELTLSLLEKWYPQKFAKYPALKSSVP